MTTLENRPNQALIVIDMQNAVVAGGYEPERVTGNIASLVDRARAAGVPVVWVQHNSDELPTGSEAWEIVPDLRPAAGEAIVQKHYGDSFEDTDLESVLAASGVGKLVVTGAQTDACVRATLHGSFVRGYDTTLVTDAHTTEDLTEWGAPTPDLVISHTNLYWNFQGGPGKTAATVASADVDFG